MECIIETLIYLLAILGIIFTSISFYEMFDLNRYINNTYRIFFKESNNKKNINVTFEIKGFNDNEEEDIIKEISNNIELKKLVNKIIIKKDNE